MDVFVRSCVSTGLAAVTVGALVLVPVPPGAAAAAMTQAATRAVQAPAPRSGTFSPLAPQAAAPLAAVAPIPQFGALLTEQVVFHVDLLVDFLVTGAQLFSRQLAVPPSLLRDLGSGVPLPAAVSRALATLVAVEIDAGRELIGFAAQYIAFQVKFLTDVVDTVLQSGVAALAASPLTEPTAAPVTSPPGSVRDDVPVTLDEKDVIQAPAPDFTRSAVSTADSESRTSVRAQGEVRISGPARGSADGEAVDVVEAVEALDTAENPPAADADQAIGLESEPSAEADTASTGEDEAAPDKAGDQTSSAQRRSSLSSGG